MRNWTIKEAVAVIKAGADAEAIKEIARINPLFVVAVAKDDIATVANMMGEKFTVRRLNNGAPDVSTSEDATEDTEDNDVDLSTLSTKELMKLCDKRGIKVPHYGKNKAFYIDALTNAGNDADTEDDEDGEDDPYAGKSAKELFNMCKKRGIEVEPKKSAKVYADALAKADAAGADEEDDDDWGDEEEAPKKTEKKEKKSEKKAKAEPEAEEESDDEDGDDDWDI